MYKLNKLKKTDGGTDTVEIKQGAPMPDPVSMNPYQMITLGTQQITKYSTIRSVLNPFLELLETTDDASRTKLKAELKQAWEATKALNKQGTSEPFKILTALGVNDNLVNNPEQLTDTKQIAKFAAVERLTSDFQEYWKDVVKQGAALLKRELEVLKDFRELANP